MQPQDTMGLEATIQSEMGLLNNCFCEIEKIIVGQRSLLERMLLALLANGHILIEGLPGLAKTLAVKTFSSVIQLKFGRIQFTPDMLPADLTGAPVFDQKTGTFSVKRGPIFANIILADEINRAPAKVQSALLEAMQEKQVTIGEQTFPLEEPFLVLATQNTIEQDGTYPLPESQLDRFMLKVKISYPSRKEEEEILGRMAYTRLDIPVAAVLDPERILKLRGLVDQVHIEPNVKDYILNVTQATRYPQQFGIADLKNYIQFGVSPRATIHLTVAAKAHALIQGRAYVRPQDVRDVAMDVLCHRVIESYMARAKNISSGEIIQKILDRIEMP